MEFLPNLDAEALDPIGFAGGDANLFRYVGNSPTSGATGMPVRLSASAYGKYRVLNNLSMASIHKAQFFGRSLISNLKSAYMNASGLDPSGFSVDSVDVLEFFTSPNHDINSVIARILVSTSVDTKGCAKDPCGMCTGNAKVTVKWKWIGKNTHEQPFDSVACIGTDCSDVLVSFDEHTIVIEGPDFGKKMEGRLFLTGQRSFEIACSGGVSAGDMLISRTSLRELREKQLDETSESIVGFIQKQSYFKVSYRVRVSDCGKLVEDSVSVSESLNQIHFSDSWANLIPPQPPGVEWHGPHWQWPPVKSGPEEPRPAPAPDPEPTLAD